jgi:organic hydroperoxide reductase OsmC/OhrA
MVEHRAQVRWQRTSAEFTYDKYNRAHEVLYKQGEIVVPASAAIDFKGDADRVDPEEQFVAALSACHMLSFLAIAARKRIVVDAYADDAVGYLEKSEGGKWRMTRVILRPSVRFAAGDPGSSTLDELHKLAHETCFIANSVTTSVAVEPQP